MFNETEIKKNIKNILKNLEIINKNVIVVAVTKEVDVEKIKYAFDAGLKYFGESKIQEFLNKIDFFNSIREKINLHFIGHLQSNKVNKAIKYFDCIQSVDSLEIAEKISKNAINYNKIQDVLLEINIGNEKSKFGFTEKDIYENIKRFENLAGIRIKGLMTIAPFFENPEKTRPYFRKMKKIFEDLKNIEMNNLKMEILSMGMSNDYLIAIEEGANMIRIGTAIFGKRN